MSNDSKHVPTVIQYLIEAIHNVKYKYIECGDITRSTSKQRKQTERSFAYELYHQWSNILERYIKSEKLQLSGEISKLKLCRSVTYPDMILHSGQHSDKLHLLVLEIKRELIESVRHAVLKDFVKLHHYLNPANHLLKYKYGGFLALNCTEVYLTAYIKDLFDTNNILPPSSELSEKQIKDIRNSIHVVSDRIYCLSVNRDQDTYTPTVKLLQLSEILL